MTIDGATILVTFGLGIILGIVGMRTWLAWAMDRDGHPQGDQPFEVAVLNWRRERTSHDN